MLGMHCSFLVRVQSRISDLLATTEWALEGRRWNDLKQKFKI
jgi:hypothetical protein